MTVPAERLRTLLGLTSINYVAGNHSLAIIDTPIARIPGGQKDQQETDGEKEKGLSAGPAEIVIDNFSFAPHEVTVPVGTTVTWLNHDDMPHNVVSTTKRFKSEVLDTDDKFTFTFQ